MKTLDVKQVSNILRLSPYTIRQMAREGKIPAVKIGKNWRFTEASIINLLEGSYHNKNKQEIR